MNNSILSIETSGSLCGVALYLNEKEYFVNLINMKYSHSDKLFELVDTVLEQSGMTANEIETIAVSAGPGSFTGLRIGLAAAKGIAMGGSAAICMVPTFEASAMEIGSKLGEGGEFILANSAGIEDIYYARFQIKANNYIFVDSLKVINIIEVTQKAEGVRIFRDYVPSPLSIATWCKRFGADLMTNDYDYIEPNYLKNFIAKEKKG